MPGSATEQMPFKAVTNTLTQCARAGSTIISAAASRATPPTTLAGPAFREDALRQCPTDRSSDPCLAGDQDPLYATRVPETCDWVLREMRGEGSDGDSRLRRPSTPTAKGEEGRFYVWSEAGDRQQSWADDAAFKQRLRRHRPGQLGSIKPSSTARPTLNWATRIRNRGWRGCAPIL